MTLLRRSPLLILLTIVGLVAAGCGDDENRASETTLDLDRVIAVAERDGTAEMTAAITAEGAGLREPLKITGKGATSQTEMQAALTLDGAPIYRAMGLPGTGAIELVVDGPAWYAQPADQQLRSMIPDGRAWLGLDLGKLAGDGPSLEHLLRIDLASSVAPFRAGAPLVEAGRERIDGVETVRWDGRISAEDYLDTLPADERTRVREQFQNGPSGLSDDELAERQPVSLWLDDELRVRRTESVTELPAAGATPAGKVTMRFDYAAFGKPELGSPPAASKTWDATEALNRASAETAQAG